ncbi:MAG: YtxH domain-containing protein [Candidatus Palauibacterales bacterium]|jgi:gas vesicle protein|nr:YtxH domain-containing protein [Candidatus Palauibacterales bacterium]
MDDYEYREALGFLAGLTIGAVIGTAAALLLAPQSGARTRRQIARRAEAWTDSAGETLEDARDEARELADKAARETRRLARRARRTADRTGDRLSDAVEKGRERLRT